MFSRGFKQAMLLFSVILAVASAVLFAVNISTGNTDSAILNVVTLVVNIGLAFFWTRELNKDEAGTW